MMEILSYDGGVDLVGISNEDKEKGRQRWWRSRWWRNDKGIINRKEKQRENEKLIQVDDDDKGSRFAQKKRLLNLLGSGRIQVNC